MDLQLAGTTALVTGASRGIGLATVHALVTEGVRVVGVARTLSPELLKLAPDSISADLSTAEGVATAVATGIERLGGLSLLVNNVGAGDVETLSLGGFLEADDHQWEGMLSLNLLAAVRASRAALPALLDGGGTMVNVATVNARVPAPSPVGYGEAKAALLALSKRLAEEFGPRGVRVNAVSPGPVGTGLWRDPQGFGAKLAEANGAPHKAFLASLPQAFGLSTGRIAEPEEIAAAICFLASPLAGSVNGAELVVDSGANKSL